MWSVISLCPAGCRMRINTLTPSYNTEFICLCIIYITRSSPWCLCKQDSLQYRRVHTVVKRLNESWRIVRNGAIDHLLNPGCGQTEKLTLIYFGSVSLSTTTQKQFGKCSSGSVGVQSVWIWAQLLVMFSLRLHQFILQQMIGGFYWIQASRAASWWKSGLLSDWCAAESLYLSFLQASVETLLFLCLSIRAQL